MFWKVKIVKAKAVLKPQNLIKIGSINSRKIVTGVAVAVFLFSAALSGCGKNEAVQQAGVQDVPVNVTTVEKGEMLQLSTLYGKLSANKTVALAPRAPGKVASVPVKVGDEVNVGQVIIQLDDSDTRAQVEQNEAALAIALAGQLEAEVTLEEARVNLERMEILYAQDAISLQGLETARNTYNRLNSGRSDAMVRQAQANLSYWRNQLDNLTITTPIKGLVASLKGEPGEMLGANITAATVVNLDVMVAECNVPEGLINSVRTGDIIKVRVPSAGSRLFDGKITSVSPAADIQSRSFPVKVEIQNPDHQLKAGMFVEIDMIAGERKEVIRVPKEAVLDKDESKVVYLVKDGIACETRVSPGISNTDLVEIVEGLQEGDIIVITGQNMIKDQTPVRVVN